MHHHHHHQHRFEKMKKLAELFALFIIFFLVQTSASAQNQAPKFEPRLQSNYFFDEFNATKQGDILLWLNATDFDDDDLEFGVESEFYRKLLTIKKVDNKHATVIANQIFDRETQEKYENIVFYVKDKPGNKVYQSVRFVILDIDDNAPVFKNTPYKISVMENQPIDTVVCNFIEAFDADGPLYNKFDFFLSNKDEQSGLFEIDKTNFLGSGHYSTNLILKRSLNFENCKTHVVNILAVSKTMPQIQTTTELFINVIDYPNRTPEFTQSPYYVKMEEEMPIGEFILKIQAKDGDTGINNPCKYEIIQDDSPAIKYFEIDSNSGAISISESIDLESIEITKLGGLLEFAVKAVEIGDELSFKTTRVIVSITDINDNTPTFNKNSFHLNLLPQSNAGSTLTLVENDIDSIRVFDYDKGINGSISLFLFNNNSYDILSDFEIIPKIVLNDGNLIIKMKSDFNISSKIGSIQHYHLIAKDNGVDGKAVKSDVFIKIEYTNQYAPQFAHKSYLFRLKENSIFNTTIGYLEAFDNDTYEEFGQITYELKNGQNRFQIDTNSGRIFTVSKNPSVELDRESIDTYYMNVDAIDGGGLRTSVQLIIKLDDVNDNRPRFISNLYNVEHFHLSTIENTTNTLIGFIEENTNVWFEPIRLQAFDRDIGVNGQIEFEISSDEGDLPLFKGYFHIDNKTNTVVLNTNKTLDFEEIVCLKKNHSLPNQLVLNPGEVEINLVILVRDFGSPSLSSKINARIIVKDVNDNKPKFEKMFYSAEIYETARIGDVIQVKAFDLDAPNTAYSKIIYIIESGNKDKFFIDSSTGMIKINENSNLDRDLYGSFYTLKIAATDFGAMNLGEKEKDHLKVDNFRNEKNSATSVSENFCFLTIKVLDVNNKKPVFLNIPEVVNISEGSPINTQLIRIEAIDPDANSNLFYFLIKDGNNSTKDSKMQAFDENNNLIDLDLYNDWFEIDSKNGNLFTKSIIDREIAELVHVVVGVEDLNASEETKPQISTVNVKIQILDVNDNYPIFPNLKLINSNYTLNDCEEPIFEMFEKVEENAKLNTKIVRLNAIDLDKEKNISYKIVHYSDLSRNLAVDKFTGDIYVNGLIDHETTKWINLTILVYDNSISSKHSLLNFYCRIIDLNDNQPKFTQLNTTEFRVYENNEINLSIAEFKAIDLDSDEYGTVVYSILSGDKDKFEIDPKNGTLIAKAVFDREEQDRYTLVIQAIDNPSALNSNQLSDSLLIKIRILDQNDNKPECDQDRYYLEVVQNVEIGTILSQIKGIDNDVGKNAQLRYFIHSNKTHDPTSTINDIIAINPLNGQIRTKKKLNEHSGLYQFTITLIDNGPSTSNTDASINDNLSGTCLVDVFVKEFNMHPPKFVFPNAKNSLVRIKSSLPYGAYLMTVNAVDEDNGENGEVLYRLDNTKLKNDDWKNFNLDMKTGVLSLNTKLNITQQSSYSIDLIAFDRGKPNSLSSRFTLILIVVDDSNNAAHFNRMQICLSGVLECEKDYTSVVIRLKEEVNNLNNTVSLNLAKMNDLSKNSSDICYYLMGIDRQHFKLNKKSGILMPKSKFDREKREKYEVIIKASEYCSCLELMEINNSTNNQCYLKNNTFDMNDISQLRVKILVQDINDNAPKFSKKSYQIGVTSDVDFGDIILDSYATDLDSTGSLNFSIIKQSLVSNVESTKSSIFPFTLKFFEESKQKSSSNISSKPKIYRFQIKTNLYIKPQKSFSSNNNKNILYQFNMTVCDENSSNTDSAFVQVILINKQQRVKLVFSQPIEKVLKFQDEFQLYISNLTGYRAYIDKIYLHKVDEDFEESRVISSSRPPVLTDMLLHFTQNENLTFLTPGANISNSSNNYLINAETILNILDRSVDLDLLKKYKLSLAEKYDDQGSLTFYKYGTLSDEDYSNFFSIDSSSNINSNLLTRLILIVACFLLTFLLVSTVVVFYCMKKTYKRKLRAERAMVKAFGLEQRSITFNDTGYLNMAFDSNSLLPIPGTNLYAYEGNPMWLKKYEKVDSKNNTSASVTSSSLPSSSSENSRENLKANSKENSKDNKSSTKSEDEITSFYLKQIDSTPASTSKCSPLAHQEMLSKKQSTNTTNDHILQQSEFPELSNSFLQPPPNPPPIVRSEPNNFSSFQRETLLTFATDDTLINNAITAAINNSNNSMKSFKKQSTSEFIDGFKDDLFGKRNKKLGQNMTDDFRQPNLSHTAFQKNSNFTKIFDSTAVINKNQKEDNFLLINQPISKDISDLFAVESTVI